MNEKITFRDLSVWLKILVVYGFINLGYDLVLFLTGFYLGFTGAI